MKFLLTTTATTHDYPVFWVYELLPSGEYVCIRCLAKRGCLWNIPYDEYDDPLHSFEPDEIENLYDEIRVMWFEAESFSEIQNRITVIINMLG